MKLEEYLKLKKLSLRKFAKLIGVTHGHVSQILRKKKSPSLLLAKQIEKVTDGKVTIYDLIEPDAPSRYKQVQDNETFVMGG